MAITDMMFTTGIVGVGVVSIGCALRIAKIAMKQDETIQKETAKSCELLGELQKKLELGDQSSRRSFK